MISHRHQLAFLAGNPPFTLLVTSKQQQISPGVSTFLTLKISALKFFENDIYIKQKMRKFAHQQLKTSFTIYILFSYFLSAMAQISVKKSGRKCIKLHFLTHSFFKCCHYFPVAKF